MGDDTDGSSIESSPAAESPRRRWRDVTKHPLILALVPAITAIIVATIALIPKSTPDKPPNNTTTATMQPIGTVAFRIEPDYDSIKGWAGAFDSPLPSTTGLLNEIQGVQNYNSAIARWAKTRGAVDIYQSKYRLYLQNNGATRVTIRSISAKVAEP